MEGPPGEETILTKGDHNPVDDRFLYPSGVERMPRDWVTTRVRGSIPMIGWASILPRERPVACGAVFVAYLGALWLYGRWSESRSANKEGEDDPGWTSAGNTLPETLGGWIKFVLNPHSEWWAPAVDDVFMARGQGRCGVCNRTMLSPPELAAVEKLE